MTVTSAISVNDILNRVAAEVGLTTDPNPFDSSLDVFVQMRYLLQTAGEELALAYPWEFLNETHQITTVAATDTGDYDLPSDWHYMIPQTGWERANNVPLGGPLTAQDWTYLLGRDLASTTIYASFRLKQGKFSIFPQPPPDALNINFEYQRRTWIEGSPAGTYIADFDAGSNTVLFDRTLITRALKMKWLGSKGFDTTAAQEDFNQTFSFITGKDQSGDILNSGGRSSGIPYLNARYNTPDTGYGQ